jgi:hypothetical protein
MRKPSVRVCFLAAAAFALALPFLGVLSAQSTTQTIQGLVTDPTGAVIPGATVTMNNLATGVVQAVQTNDTGNYTFALVPVGSYELRCEASGFKTDVVTGVRVETGAQVRQNFVMQVGEVTETVEVSAAAVTLNTENATVGAVIENRRIVELPLNGRNVQNLAVLTPGVQFGSRTGLGDGSAGFPIPGQGFSVSANGQREIHQVVALDGVDAKDPRIHITNFVPSIEAIEEFKIQTNAYSAEVGFGGGAHVNITMKSGTNELHGTLFEFLRNDKFDAEDYFLNFERAAAEERSAKDPLRQNQFGAVVSGPLIRNKTFWAFNYEGRRTRRGAVQTEEWPIDPFRGGDFSALASGYTANNQFVRPTLIYDPFTGDVFNNNVLPQSRLHAGALNLLDLYIPRAQFVQQDPTDFTARAAVSQPINVNTYFGRVDHYFSDSDRVFARLALDRSNLDRNNINPNLPVFVTSKVSNLATQWIHTFSQNMINEVRVGFQISDDLTSNPRTDDESFDQDGLGVGEFLIPSDGSRKLTPREHGIPRIIGLPFTLQELTNGNGYDNMDTVQIGNHLSWIKGAHNIKIGGEYYRISMERGAANLEEGSLAFSSNETGYALASFLLGLPRESGTPEGLPLTFPRANRFAFYIHDDWKATPRLTVNIGLRFDYNGFPVDSQGLWRTLTLPGEGSDLGRGIGYTKEDGTVIPTVFPEFVDERGAVKMAQQDVRFFMPRIGIAYRPTDKWVLRAGAGWFDNINHTNTFTIFNLMPPKAGSQTFQTSLATADTVSVQGADGNSYELITRQYAPGSNILTLDDPFLFQTGGTSTVRPVNVTYAPPDYHDGDVWKWSFDVQRELPNNTVLTVGYAGSKGSHVGNSIANFNDPYELSGTFRQENRPYPEFYDAANPELGVQGIGRIRYIDSYGESFYHGLQVRLDKRYARGVTFGLSYTWSKSHGDGENGGQEGASFQNVLDRRGSRGLFRFDQTHNFVGHFVWELPGQQLQGVAKHILGGWQANGILSLRSGFPFGLTQSTADVGLANASIRPDVVGETIPSDPTRKLWYNPQAFQRVTCRVPGQEDLCHYGNLGYNALRGPGQSQMDFSLYKNFAITERYRVQFRWEAFNVFNTPFFSNPGNISFSSTSQLTPDGSRNGEIRSLRTAMRIMQFGLKFSF